MYSKRANQIVVLCNSAFFVVSGEIFGCGNVSSRVFGMGKVRGEPVKLTIGELFGCGIFPQRKFKKTKNVRGEPVKLTIPGLENKSIEAIYCTGTDSDFRLLIQTKEDEIYVVYDNGKEFTEKAVYIKALSHKRIVQTSTYYSDCHVTSPVGFRHTLFLTQSGEVFGCGYNKFGQYGNRSASSEVSLFPPQKIPFPPKIRIHQVLAQDNVSIFVANKGRVFACGKIESIVIRTGFRQCYKPTEIFLLEGEDVKIRSVTRGWRLHGSNKILCLTETGEVHSIELGDDSLDRPIIQRELKFPSNVRIEKIQSGGNRSVFFKYTDNRWYCTMNRRKGLSNTRNDSVSHEKLSSFLFDENIQHLKPMHAFHTYKDKERQIKIVDIYLGFENVFVVTPEGDVYAREDNENGQLDIKRRKNHINFKLVSNIKVKPSTYKSENELNEKLMGTCKKGVLYGIGANQTAMIPPNATIFVSNGKLLVYGPSPGRFDGLTVSGLKELEKKFIRSIYCIGDDYDASLFIQTQSDEIYVVFGVGVKRSKGASFLPALSYKAIVQISGDYDSQAKNNHILCLTQNGEVFIYWHNKSRQFDDNYEESATMTFKFSQKIFFPPGIGIRVKEVLAVHSKNVSIFVTECGCVFACNKINLPIPHCYYNARKIFSPETKKIRISSITLDQCDTNIFCLTETGDVYIIELTTNWLRNLDIKSRPLKFPKNVCIERIQSGRSSSMFFKSINGVWYYTKRSPQKMNIRNKPANPSALPSLSFASHFSQPKRCAFYILENGKVKLNKVSGHEIYFGVTSEGDVYIRRYK